MARYGTDAGFESIHLRTSNGTRVTVSPVAIRFVKKNHKTPLVLGWAMIEELVFSAKIKQGRLVREPEGLNAAEIRSMVRRAVNRELEELTRPQEASVEPEVKS